MKAEATCEMSQTFLLKQTVLSITCKDMISLPVWKYTTAKHPSIHRKNTQAYHRKTPADQQVWIQNILALKAFCLTVASGCLLYITVVSLRKAQQWLNEDYDASFRGRRFVNCELLGAAAQSLTQTLNCSLWCWLTPIPIKTTFDDLPVPIMMSLDTSGYINKGVIWWPLE